MQLDDAFPTPWKRVASADHRPLNALEPGAWERASAAAPGLFTNDVHAMTTGGARPQAAAPAANWEAPLANFGSSLDSVASHISSMIGPVPAYNGPCQCKACFAIFRRLRSFMFEWGFFGPKEINEQIDDRFCFGERWQQRSECYFLLGNYRDLITTMLYFGMEPQSMCRMLFQCA
jgi:hypothetical protein